MPNRILKDSIRTSKSVNALTDFQFRLWAYLITYVDDYGRGRAEPDIIKGFVFPRRKNVTEATINGALSDLANMGMIRLYEVNGDCYLYFPNWQDHQTIRAAKSKFPAPPESTCKQMQADASSGNQVQADSPVFDNRESKFDNRESRIRETEKATHTQRFTPPTVEDATQYAREKGWTEAQFSPERFVDFYASKGWKVGKEPMKDWRAAARGWVARQDKPTGKPQGWKNPALDYQQREYTDEEMEDTFLDLEYYGKTGKMLTKGEVKKLEANK